VKTAFKRTKAMMMKEDGNDNDLAMAELSRKVSLKDLVSKRYFELLVKVKASC
jgi:hypothetical protein